MALTEEEKAVKQAAKDKAAEEKRLAKEAKDKEKADAKAAKAAAKPAKVETVKQNGIARPNKGKTLRVWEIADAISKETKAPATRKAVTEAAAKEALEVGTTHTQYGRWRKFHGLTGLREVNQAEKAAVAKPDPAAKPLTPAQQKKADAAAAKAAAEAGAAS